jgi:hypothetical protein
MAWGHAPKTGRICEGTGQTGTVEEGTTRAQCVIPNRRFKVALTVLAIHVCSQYPQSSSLSELRGRNNLQFGAHGFADYLLRAYGKDTPMPLDF